MRTRWIPSMLLLLIGVAGCPEPERPSTCAEGLVADGDRCVPRFEDCPLPFEVPVLGGGCQPVGPTACATGMVSDGEGGCAPVVPDAPCAPGTFARLGETTCQPVGPTACATGMASDGEGGCAPVLPPAPCGDGLLDRLGGETCEPLQDCGGAPWGAGPLDATAVFVDASAVPGSGDGSAGAPFATVAEAVAAVEPGGQVVVASGRYAEAVLVDRPLRLRGRCAAEVVLEGPEGPFDATGPLTILPAASGTSITGITVTGGGRGVNVTGATDVLLEAVVVRDTGGAGLYVQAGGSVTARRLRVDRATGHGLYGLGSDLRLEDSVIQSTRPREDGTGGRGITTTCDEPAGRCGGLVVERSILRANRGFGIITLGQEVDVTGSVVSGTLPTADSSTFGRGISLQCHPAVASCPPARISGCVVSGNHDMGIYVGGVMAEIIATVVEDTLPRPATGTFGRGVDAECNADLGECGSVVIRQSLVRRNTEIGVFSWGVPLDVKGTIISDQVARPADGDGGRGFGLECNPLLDRCGAVRIEGCLIAGNAQAGVFAAGMDVDVVRSTVIDTLPHPHDDLGGAGLGASCHPQVGKCTRMRVEESLVTGNASYGIAVAGADLTVVASAVTDSRSGVDGRWGRGISAQCHLEMDRCGTLVVEGSHVARNRDAGIAVAGSVAVVRQTTVRDTLPMESGLGFGRGINARCDYFTDDCGSIRIEDCLVSRSTSLGIFAAGQPVDIARTAILETQPDAGVEYGGMFGVGLWVQIEPALARDATLLLVDSLVDGAFTAGVTVEDASARVEGCVVRNIAAQVLDGHHGFGITAGTGVAKPGLWLEVDRSLLLDAVLSGLYLRDIDGQVHRTRIAGGKLTVVYTHLLRLLDIGDDNDLSGSVTADPLRDTSLTTVPAAPPVEMAQEAP